MAGLATLGALLFGAPLGYVLARRSFVGRRLVLAVTMLPLVLPPTAVGFLLLMLLADRGPLGRDQLGFDLDILFTRRAAVLASTVMAFPLVLRTARVAFEAVNPRLEQMARTLGRTSLETFFEVTLPLARRGLLAAAVLGFMRALGEFGATVMIAGNIPSETQTLALAIYGAQQAGSEAEAYVLLAIAIGVGIVALFLAEWLTDGGRSPRPQ